MEARESPEDRPKYSNNYSWSTTDVHNPRDKLREDTDLVPKIHSWADKHPELYSRPLLRLADGPAGRPTARGRMGRTTWGVGWNFQITLRGGAVLLRLRGDGAALP